MPFSRGSSQPRDQTHVSHIEDGFFTIWATRVIITCMKNEQIWNVIHKHTHTHIHIPALCNSSNVAKIKQDNMNKLDKLLRQFKASLLAQWWRICLPVEETHIRALIQGGPTGLGAAKPMSDNYRACAPEPGNGNYEPRRHNHWKLLWTSACALQREPPPQREARRSQLENSPHSL